MENIAEFYSKTVKVKNCLIWQGGKDKKGYGVVNWRGKKNKRAHRLSFELSNGEIPLGLFVCHTCDIPACINPKHLWLGTPKQNTDDMISKGRNAFKKGGVRPSHFPFRPNHKLSEEDIFKIKEMIKNGFTMVDIANLYKVSDRTINDINVGKLWGSLDSEEERKIRAECTKLTKSRVRKERMRKLSNDQIKEIKFRLSQGEGQKKIGFDYGVSQFCIYEIKHELRWKEIK